MTTVSTAAFGAQGRSAAGLGRPEVLVTLPVRDEAPRLVDTLRALSAALDAAGFRYRLSVAEDGSTDGTKELLARLPTEFPGILIQQHERSLGRGKALRLLWAQVDADIYCFTDTDLATGPNAVVDAIRHVLDGEEIVVGSRYAPGAEVHRPPLRELVSKVYNALLRLTFRERIRDHQCGLKVFSAESIRRLLPASREDSWFWDTEILVLALQANVPVLEMPVYWVERKTRRTRLGRLFSDIYLHGTGLVRLRSRIQIPRGELPPVRRAGPTPDASLNSRF
jgi:glycosyltransferase involved in cell wall biosynthesis